MLLIKGCFQFVQSVPYDILALLCLNIDLLISCIDSENITCMNYFAVSSLYAVSVSRFCLSNPTICL